MASENKTAMQVRNCYTTRAQQGSEHLNTIEAMVKDGRLDKHSNIIIMTKSEFENIVSEIIDDVRKELKKFNVI